ncbi:hypothetical protein TorRG33x02_332090 [Trema orientale]|uniref:Uncharacterized protein n=1 Tax=Trema orientale TaxID=63057 RepID=A0A2P5B5L4_TREOI|nr:hypothetical protein TorRG33x02_332090 [Trema orientale]
MAARNIIEPITPTPILSVAPKNPDSGEDPPVPATVSAENPENEEPDSTREPKRRRYCPKALEKVEELVARPDPNPNFSFSFDTKFMTGSGTETTPKFGSFDLKALVSEKKNPNCKEEKPDREPSEISSNTQL